MKATLHGQYFKAGRKVLTFKVTGTAKELEQYKSIQETQTNREAGTWPEVDGSPLYFLVPSVLMSNGEMPQKTYNLIFNQDGTKVIRDTSAQDMQMYEQVRQSKIDNMGRIAAEREMGIGVARPATTPTVAQPAANGKAKEAELVDGIINDAGVHEEHPAGIGELGNVE